MAYRSPQRQGEFGANPQSLQRKQETLGSKVSSWLQVIGIFLLLRIIMYALGMPYIYVPLLDPAAQTILNWGMRELVPFISRF